MMPHLVVASAIVLADAVSLEAVFTLYRNSALDASIRMHVATYDTDQGSSHNRENCWTAQKPFQVLNGVAEGFCAIKDRLMRSFGEYVAMNRQVHVDLDMAI